MSWRTMTIVRKELRSYFLSPVALIFLGIFLVANLFIFFTLAKFFARNLADVRPLFNWLPILLIFLVSAMTMRQWSEEQKIGTLEVLLTLPVRTSELVLGKFIAGMVLVGLALLLTVPLPLTVSNLGHLDWGPVIGGYVGAMLLASAYMSIGLCISARTDNQIVALMVALVVGGVLYLIGAQSVASFFGNETAEVLRAIGTGSRFESIERGVLDLRDFFYYASITLFFLALNIYFLELKRMDAQPAECDTKRPVLRTTILLLGLNAVVGNLWLAPVTNVRADLTSDREYSISETTERILDELTEPLTITGYFSERTHPLLAPLVPRIRDFLTEYEIRSNGTVRLSFANPSQDEELEEEINEQYGIRSVPFQLSGRNEQALVNSFFHILIKYGDEYQVLTHDDLLEFHADDTAVNVRLRNLEYDLTRAIRKVSQGFQSLESVLAAADAQVKVTGYISPQTLPVDFAPVPERIQQALETLTKQSGNRVSYGRIDPTNSVQLQQEIMFKYGFRPIPVNPYSNQRFWCYLLAESGERKVPIYLDPKRTSEVEIRNTIEAGLRRMAPGFLKTIGLITKEEKDRTPEMPGMQKKGPQRDYRYLEMQLSEEFEVRLLDVSDGAVPSDIDVLVIAKPASLSPKSQYAIDQYLMRGGSVIVLAGAYEVKPVQANIIAERIDSSLFDLLRSYGVEVDQAFVMDQRNLSFPIPVRQRRGANPIDRIELIPYPFFANVRQDGFNQENVALKGIMSVAFTWSSPVRMTSKTDESGQPLLGEDGLPIIQLPEGIKGEYLAWSSPQSWLKLDTRLEPDFETFPDKGFGAPADAVMGINPIAVSLVGTFTSHFAERPSPLVKAVDPNNEESKKADRTGTTIKSANKDARLVVIGSGELASDLVASLARQVGVVATEGTSNSLGISSTGR